MKVHWGEKAEGDALFSALCGHLPSTVATLPSEVTCKLCLREMRKGAGGSGLRAALSLQNALAYPTRAVPDRWEPQTAAQAPLYMTQPPIAGGRLYCKCGMCETCHHFIALDAQYAGRLRNVRKRPMGEQRFRFGHVVAALEWYADLIEDGGLRRYGSPLGAIAETGTRVSGSDVELEPMERLAWYVGAIREALGQCYLGPSERCLSKAQRLTLMFDCGVGRRARTKRGSIERIPTPAHQAARDMGHGLDADSVGQIVRQGLAETYRVLRSREVVG